MRYVLLFPGQASQSVGMGDELRAASEAAERLFRLADDATGLPISAVCSEGPLECLTQTEYAQPAVVVCSLATLEVLRERLGLSGSELAPTYFAGHSVGELAALSAAGALTAVETLKLVARRSRLMSQACAAVRGGMAAVVGMAPEPLANACEMASAATNTRLELANLNAPDQIVVSGHCDALDWLSAHGPELGVRRVLMLNVSGPFHSSYMKPAAEAFARDLSSAEIFPPATPVVLNQSAATTTDPEVIRRELSEQVAAPVLWSASLKLMEAAGCTAFIEVGPGKVLTGLVKKTVPDASAVATADLASIDQAVALLTS